MVTDGATRISSDSVRTAPTTRSPGTAQVISELPEHPAGSGPTVTSAGGSYVNVSGPAAVDGPALWAVSTTVADSPGFTEGDDIDSDTSATGAPTTTVVLFTELSASAGSVDDDDTEAGPPLSAAAVVVDGTETTMATEVEPPDERSDGTTQTIDWVPVHPGGRLTRVVPVGRS